MPLWAIVIKLIVAGLLQVTTVQVAPLPAQHASQANLTASTNKSININALTDAEISLANSSTNLDDTDLNISKTLESGTLFEGDIVIDDDEDPNTFAETLRLYQRARVELAQAGVYFDDSSFWKWTAKVVPYEISSEINNATRLAIAKAILTFHDKTCVRFRPRNLSDAYYIKFVDGYGCSSRVGRHSAAQKVTLGYGCHHSGLVFHELMHVLGFWHEHARKDRDSYVLILWQNIYPLYRRNFEKYTVDYLDHLNVGYDLGSLMHYEPTSFTMNGLPTLQALTGVASFGQRSGPSNKDILKINRLYQCPAPDTGTVVTAGLEISSTTGIYNPVTPITTPATSNSNCKDADIKINDCTRYNQTTCISPIVRGSCPRTCGLCDQPKDLQNAHLRPKAAAATLCSIVAARGSCVSVHTRAMCLEDCLIVGFT